MREDECVFVCVRKRERERERDERRDKMLRRQTKVTGFVCECEREGEER